MSDSTSELTPEEVEFLQQLDSFVLDDSYLVELDAEYDSKEGCDDKR